MSGKLNHAACQNTEEVKFKRYIDGNDQMIGLSCDNCLSEWVLPKFLDDPKEGGETINISGKDYKLIKKKELEDSQLRFPKHCTKFVDLTAAEESLKVGDHIFYETYIMGAIIHHAIIVKKEKSDENNVRFALIHWKKLNLKDYEVVKEENVDLSKKTKCVTRCDYPEDYVRADPTELTIARATTWIGQKDYSLFFNNCEHFAIFCKIGCPKSFQQELIKTKVMHLLQEICGFGVRVSTGVGKKVLARAAADALGDTAEYGVTHGGRHFLTVSTQSIGFGVVVAINGVFFTIDIGKAYDQHRKEKLTFSEFKDKIWRQFITRLERIYFTGVIPAACAVGYGIAVTNPATWGTVGILVVGAIFGGVLATAIEGFGQTKAGRTLSYTLRPILDHSDKSVESIRDLSPGDHVVISKWALHPRCHIIIVDIKEEEQNMKAIRFTYQKGIVEELLPFKKPVYKVIYNDRECFPPEEVIRRASEKKQEQRLEYSITGNNCKSFARWCKTGRGPRSLFAIKGYEDEDKGGNKGGDEEEHASSCDVVNDCADHINAYFISYDRDVEYGFEYYFENKDEYEDEGWTIIGDIKNLPKLDRYSFPRMGEEGSGL